MNLVKKIPWGIIAGASAMISFFCIIAFVVLYIVDSGVAAQTSETVGLFDGSNQVVLFTFGLIFGVLFIGSLVMWILFKTGVIGKEGNK